MPAAKARSPTCSRRQPDRARHSGSWTSTAPPSCVVTPEQRSVEQPLRAVQPLDLTPSAPPAATESWSAVAPTGSPVPVARRRCSRPARGRHGRVLPGPARRRGRHRRTAAPQAVAPQRRASAYVYAWPTYDSPDSDVIVGATLRRDRRAGRRRPAAGSTPATSSSSRTRRRTRRPAVHRRAASSATRRRRRSSRRRASGSTGSTRPGTQDGSVYLQVGIGSGNTAGTFNGDHDLWRLPEKDDALTGAEQPLPPPPPGLPRQRARRAAAAQPRRPRLGGLRAGGAGRRGERTRPARRRARDRRGDLPAPRRRADVTRGRRHRAARTRSTPSRRGATTWSSAAPSWRSPAQALGDPRAGDWLRPPPTGRAYLAHEAGDDTLNLYDTSAVAHADLIRAMAGQLGRPRSAEPGAARRPSRPARTRRQPRARGPVRGRQVYDDFDVASHTLRAGGDGRALPAADRRPRYDRFATAQRDWVLGANPWGVSLMIGVGSRFPAARSTSSPTSRRPRRHAAVLRRRGRQRPQRRRAVHRRPRRLLRRGHDLPGDGGDRYAAFTGHGSRFVDDVRSWQTVEPALDFTATAALAFALLQ